MGGIAGHLSYLHEDKNLTFGDIKKILTLTAKGELVGTEKLDGYNIFLSFRDGQALAARNKNDIKTGGMNLEDLTNRDFAGGEKVRSTYLKAVKCFEDAAKYIPNNLKNKIFENGTNFYNTEIFGPLAQNVVRYGDNFLTIHNGEHIKYNQETKELEPLDYKNYVNLVNKAINMLERKSSNMEFKFRKSIPIKLQKMESREDLKIAIAKIDKLMNQYGLENKNTIMDYLSAFLSPRIDAALPEISPNIKEVILRSVLGVGKLTGGEGIPKGTSADVRSRISQTVKDCKQLSATAIYPLEEIIHDFAVEALRNVESPYIADNKGEVQRVRKQLSDAIGKIKNSENQEAILFLKKQLAKIKRHDNVTTAIEGIVFPYKNKSYKFTGNFAPINQIFGLFKYGRGKIPPFQKRSLDEEEVGNKYSKVIAVFPGGFKPPHAGHFKIAKNIIDKYNVDEMYIFISPKARAGHSADKRVEITAHQSLLMWKLYAKGLPIRPSIAKTISPVEATYDFMKRLSSGDILLLVQSEKEKTDNNSRFSNAQQWANDQGYNIKVKVVHAPIEENGISGTDMRGMIAAGEKEKFISFLPEHINSESKVKIWNLLYRGVKEMNQTLKEDMVKGGLGDDKSDEDFDQEQLKVGMEVEKEHTNDQDIAKEIAKDHLIEDPEYYKKLKGIGLEEEFLVGGVGDGKSDEEFDKEQLRAGIKVEMEHTENYDIAKEVAKDHLSEDPEYYVKLQKIEEESSMAAGSVEGYAQKDRKDFLDEIKLRASIQSIITEIEAEETKNQVVSELKLREKITQLIKEVKEESPYKYTGINILEELLKKIIPVIEQDYKMLTTSEEQRRSCRAHLIKAVQNTLSSEISMEKASPEEKQLYSKMINIKEEDEDPDSIEPDINVKVGEGEKETPEEKFIDVDAEKNKKPSKEEEKELEKASFGIDGEDSTGRNMALTTYKKIEQNIMDSYSLLSDEEDKSMFYDYLITNLKLYFDKFEDELQINLQEPTNAQYEKEKQGGETEEIG